MMPYRMLSKTAVFLFSFLILFGAVRVQAQGPAGMRMKTNVPAGKVTEQSLAESNIYPGLVVSPQLVNVVSRVSGDLLEVCFKDGVPVKQGQVLYKLKDIKYRAAVKNAESLVEQSKAKAAYAKQSYERNEKLLSSKAVSQDTFESASSTLSALKAGLEAAEAELISAQEDLDNCVIKAPISGMIAATKYTAGNYITPNSGTLLTIFEIDKVRVRFSMSTRDYLSGFGTFAKLKEEGQIQVTLSNGEIYDRAGEVELINLEANRNTDTVQVYALFPNPEHKLIPNSTVNVTLNKKTSRNLAAVPMAAVMHDAKGAYVFVIDDKNVVHKRNFEPAGTSGEYQLAESGLKPGEAIVIDGTHKVADGMEIEPEWTKE